MLTIAGLGVAIHSRWPLLREANPAYATFFDSSGPSPHAPAAIEADVLLTPAPPNDAPPIFDSDISWRMQPEYDGYRVSFRRLDSEQIHTVMCSNQATTQVRIHIEQDQPPDLFAAGVVDPVCYPLDQLMFMNHLALRGGVICHAAAAVPDAGALVFAGVSGAGKTTVSQLFQAAGLGDTLLSDDRVILRRADGLEGAETVTAWGTPWHGDAHIARNASAPLAALLFLVKADAEELVRIPPGQAMRRLMPMVSSPWYDPDRLPAVLETCGRIVETVPCFDLRFRKDGRVVDLVTHWDFEAEQ